MDPIFIVGCQRSGTTFLGSLLGADPDTIAIPEAQFVADLATADPDQEVELAAVIDAITRHYRFGIWNFDLQGRRPAGRGRYAEAIRWLVREYAAACGKPDPVRWIDHQPGHVREMAELRAHFPQLKAIHIVRDGRAVAASLLPLHWGPNAVPSAARFWAQRVAMGQALRGFLGDGAWIEGRYEQLVTEPESALRQLCEFVGMPFNLEMLEGTGFKVPAFTQNQHALVGRRPDPARLESWKSSLSRRDVEMFEALVGPILTYLGYGRMFDHSARLPDFKEKTVAMVLDQWRAIRNGRRFAKRVEAFRT